MANNGMISTGCHYDKITIPPSLLVTQIQSCDGKDREATLKLYYGWFLSLVEEGLEMQIKFLCRTHFWNSSVCGPRFLPAILI